MSNEISINIGLRVRNGKLQGDHHYSIQKDQATAGVAGASQLLSTNTEVLTFTDITSNGWGIFQNLSTATSTASYIQIGPSTGVGQHPLVRLDSGDVAVFPVKPGVTVHGQVVTGTTGTTRRLDIRLYER